MRTLVAGGAGFIGSHLVNKLIEGENDVTVIDNFSTGKREWVSKKAEIVEMDLRDSETSVGFRDFDLIYHLAANYSVQLSTEDPRFDKDSNFLTTFNLLETMRKNEIPKIVFISSSTVYGEQETQPIPETAQLRPISNYGSSKIASEVYIHSYCKLYGLNGLVLRLANIMGPRSDHGVVPDFVKKLKENPKRLVILGNGKQKKSYLHVEDTISATILTTPKCSGFEVYNIGSDETIIVDEMAKIVCDEMKLKDVKLEHTSREKRGWKGDVSEFLLDTEKLRNLGWKPKYKTEDAIRSTVRWLVETRHRLAVF